MAVTCPHGQLASIPLLVVSLVYNYMNLSNFRLFLWTEKVLDDALSLNTFGNLSHAGDDLELHH